MAWRDSTLSLEGDSTIGHRSDQVRMFTRYDLQGGPLKGVFFGGGLSYSGEAIIGKAAATNTFIKSPALWEAEALLGYRMQLGKFLGKNVRLSLQLNAQNLLQDEPIAHLRADSAGQIYRGVVNPPRRYLLSAKLNF